MGHTISVIFYSIMSCINGSFLMFSKNSAKMLLGAVQNVRLGRHHLPGKSDNDDVMMVPTPWLRKRWCDDDIWLNCCWLHLKWWGSCLRYPRPCVCACSGPNGSDILLRFCWCNTWTFFFSIYVLEALAQARVSFARELPSNDCPNLNSFSGFH